MVRRAMLKWPNVPNVFGWLRLDRRGNWLLQVSPGRFERIGNIALVDFIGRNYEHDEQGRWFFQNGPQRVFVQLAYTPYVFHLGEDRRQWQTQAGVPAGKPLELLIDEADSALLVTGLGPGLVLDRDLPALIESLGLAEGGDIDMEALIARLRTSPERAHEALCLFGEPVKLSVTAIAKVARRFGYIAEPQPDVAAAQGSA